MIMSKRDAHIYMMTAIVFLNAFLVSVKAAEYSGDEQQKLAADSRNKSMLTPVAILHSFVTQAVVEGEWEFLKSNAVILFDYDSSRITSDYFAVLKRHVAYLKKYPHKTIKIEGHTDERGTPEYNLALGERNANAIANYMIYHGVTPSQIQVISYGEERPVSLGSSDIAYATNRRAAIVYH